MMSSKAARNLGSKTGRGAPASILRMPDITAVSSGCRSWWTTPMSFLISWPASPTRRAGARLTTRGCKMRQSIVGRRDGRQPSLTPVCFRRLSQPLWKWELLIRPREELELR